MRPKRLYLKEYSIFLDEATNDLFGYLTIADKTKLDELPNESVMQKWWVYMNDLMETNEDSSPIINVPLKSMFYLP